MDKRIKILLIVLVALIAIGGGYYAYIIMTAEETVMAVAPPVAGEAPEAPAAEQEETQKEPADKPAEAAGAEKPKEAVQAEMQVPKEQEKPGDGKKGEAKPPEVPAPCVAVISADVKGKKVEFKTPEEFLEKSGMDKESITEFSKTNLEAAKKAAGELEKAKAPAAELDCARKKLELADRLSKLVEEKFPAKPEKEVYTYSSLDKRDPFMSPAEIPRVYPPVPKNAPPIERIPAEQIKVQGIIWNERGFRALATLPDGRGYMVKVGDTIGNKNGKITRISEKRVYVEERIPDIFGDIEVRNIVLKLYKEAE